QDSLVATELEPPHHLRAPPGHRRREAIVGGGVPVARHPESLKPARTSPDLTGLPRVFGSAATVVEASASAGTGSDSKVVALGNLETCLGSPMSCDARSLR